MRDLERLRAAARGARPDRAARSRLARGRRTGPPRSTAGLAGAARGTSRPAARQWIGLAAALVIVTIGAYFFLRTRSPPAAIDGGNAPADASVEAVADELRLAMQHYENAITELEALSKTQQRRARSGDRGHAPAEHRRRSIARSPRAAALVRENPESGPARDSLFEALRRKVDVLQATVTLMNEMRQGDQAGAAESAALAGKKG